MTLSGAISGNTPMNIAGRIAKYLATSLAIENVVSVPRVISSCLPTSTTSSSLVGLRVEVDHVAGLLGRLRAGVHGHADVGLGQRRRVVGAVAGHRHQLALGLLVLDERASWPRAWPRPGSRRRRPRAAMAAAVRGLSPVIITVRMPMARKRAKRSLMPPLTMSLRWMTPSTRLPSATASGVPPASPMRVGDRRRARRAPCRPAPRRARRPRRPRPCGSTRPSRSQPLMRVCARERDEVRARAACTSRPRRP